MGRRQSRHRQVKHGWKKDSSRHASIVAGMHGVAWSGRQAGRKQESSMQQEGGMVAYMYRQAWWQEKERRSSGGRKGR